MNMDNMDIVLANANVAMEDMNADHVNIPGTSLLSLDDMLLSTIVANLCVEDIASLAETCMRLADISNKHCERNLSSLHWDCGYGGAHIEPSASERVWKYFGKFVKAIKLSYWENEEFEELLPILAKYCNKLETMTLDSVVMTEQNRFDEQSISAMFSQLKRFEIIGCVWKRCPLQTLFGRNSTLEELSIIECYRFTNESYMLSLSGFSALTKLNVQHCERVLSNHDLIECFKANSITSFTINDMPGISFFETNMIDSLADTLETLTLGCVNNLNSGELVRLKKLTSLTFNCRKFKKIDTLTADYGNNLICEELQRLQRLTSLTIHCHKYSNIDKLLRFNGDNAIKELVLSRVIISRKTISALKNFTNVTTFRINRCQNMNRTEFFDSLSQSFPQLDRFIFTYNADITDSDIITVVQSIKTLRRLSLRGCNALKTETYFDIEKIITDDWQRPNLQFIPPVFESLKQFEDVKSINKPSASVLIFANGFRSCH